MELFEAHEENAQARLEGSRIALKAAIDKAENFGGVAAVRVQHLADMLAELSRPEGGSR